MNENMKQLQARAERAADVALEQKKYVSPIDVLVGVHWLQQSVLDQWRQGRLPSLERGIEVNLHKLSTAMHLFRSWGDPPGARAERDRLCSAEPRAAALALQRQRTGGRRAWLPHALGVARIVGAKAAAARRAAEPAAGPGGHCAAQRMDLLAVRWDRGLLAPGGPRASVPDLRRHGPPRLPAGGRCDAQPARKEGEPPVAGRGAVLEGAEAVRAAGDPGRRGGPGAGGGRVPGG